VKVIVTGWRGWSASERNVQRLWSTLDALHDLGQYVNGGLQLVVGDCPTGADDEVAKWYQSTIEEGCEHHIPPLITFHADWDKYGKAAGPIRNQEMVNGGADLCLAFLHPESRGTLDCMGRAEVAQIPVQVVAWMAEEDFKPEPPFLEAGGKVYQFDPAQGGYFPLSDAA
jgi:YspA, cpYpsA-related SLOG family